MFLVACVIKPRSFLFGSEINEMTSYFGFPFADTPPPYSRIRHAFVLWKQSVLGMVLLARTLPATGNGTSVRALSWDLDHGQFFIPLICSPAKAFLTVRERLDGYARRKAYEIGSNKVRLVPCVSFCSFFCSPHRSRLLGGRWATNGGHSCPSISVCVCAFLVQFVVLLSIVANDCCLVGVLCRGFRSLIVWRRVPFNPEALLMHIHNSQDSDRAHYL